MKRPTLRASLQTSIAPDRIARCLAALSLLLVLAAPCAWAQDKTDMAPAASHPRVKLETSKGAMVLELYPDKAPKTVANFLDYVKSGFFDGTIFHRVIPGFMIQGGGFTPDMQQKPTRDPVQNESNNGLSNERGTIAMARTSDPNSATAQFYINVVDNSSLNFSGGRLGYTVFGKVVEGMDVADAISKVPTTRRGRMSDVPQEPVEIQKVTLQPAG